MSLKALKIKIASTQSIQKITASMKMVAASKMRGAENRLFGGRPFGSALTKFFPQPEKEFDEGNNIYHLSTEEEENHICLVTSDRGLCGGVNTFVCKTGKFGINELEAAGKSVEVSILGDKGRSQMHRVYGDRISSTMDECYKKPVNFAVASGMAGTLLDADKALTHIIYNKFQSAISYDTSIFEMKNLTATHEGDAEDAPFAHLDEYEFEPENKGEALENFKEFTSAAVLFNCLVEGACSEESSRMQAMDNATKNAGEMIDKLTLKYNRARQAVITTELIEIISGASALED